MKKVALLICLIAGTTVLKAQQSAPQPPADTLVTIKIKVSDLAAVQGILKYTYETADNNAVSPAYEIKQLKAQIARLFPLLQPVTELKKVEVKPQPKKKS